MNFFLKFFYGLRLREAVRKSNLAHSQTGERYYVMPRHGSGGRLIIMDRSNFRRLKLKHYIAQNATVRDCERECFYCTPYRDGSRALDADLVKLKWKQFFNWVEHDRLTRKQSRKWR